MSFILALLSFYYGTNNIISAFRTPISEFEAINWLLLLTGVCLIIVGFACTYQAVKDQKEKAEKKEAEKSSAINPSNDLLDENIEYETDIFNYDIDDDTQTIDDDDF